MSKLFRCGYSGGKGGKDFSDDDKIKLSENNIKINQIGVKSDKFVDSICITYSLNNEESVTGERHGESKGDLDIFNLDENEYVTKVNGRFGGMIDSLEIVTNLGSKKDMEVKAVLQILNMKHLTIIKSLDFLDVQGGILMQ